MALVIVAMVLVSTGLLLIFLPAPVSAAVAISSSAGCTQSATNTNVCTITITITASHTVVVGVSTPGVRTVSSISGGGTYTKRSSLLSTVDSEIWATNPGASTSASSMTVTMNGNGRFVAFATDYTGVLFFGPTFPTASGSAADPTISYTLDDGNDWFVAVLTNTGTAPTSKTGNLRDARAVTGASQGYVDNTNAAAVSVTDAITHAATAWTAASIELVQAAGCSRIYGITYASGSAVEFSPTAPLNGAATAATGQGAGTPAMTITNKGPGACSISIKRASAAPAGVEDQWNTANSAPASGTNDVTLSYVSVCASIAEASTCTIYMWSRVTASSSTPPTTYSNTYNIQQA